MPERKKYSLGQKIVNGTLTVGAVLTAPLLPLLDRGPSLSLNSRQIPAIVDARTSNFNISTNSPEALLSKIQQAQGSLTSEQSTVPISTTPSRRGRQNTVALIDSQVSEQTILDQQNADSCTTQISDKYPTFWDIAQEYHVPVQEIEQLNPGIDPKKLYSGESVNVPCEGTPTPNPTQQVNNGELQQNEPNNDGAEALAGGALLLLLVASVYALTKKKSSAEKYYPVKREEQIIYEHKINHGPYNKKEYNDAVDTLVEEGIDPNELIDDWRHGN